MAPGITVRAGSVGPKMETEGTASAVARCSGPLSLVTTTEQCEIAAATCRTSPDPPITAMSLFAAMASACSRSPGLVSSTTE